MLFILYYRLMGSLLIYKKENQTLVSLKTQVNLVETAARGSIGIPEFHNTKKLSRWSKSLNQTVRALGSLSLEKLGQCKNDSEKSQKKQKERAEKNIGKI